MKGSYLTHEHAGKICHIKGDFGGDNISISYQNTPAFIDLIFAPLNTTLITNLTLGMWLIYELLHFKILLPLNVDSSVNVVLLIFHYTFC